MLMTTADVALPGLDCGLCGFKLCSDLAARLPAQPELLERCIHLAPKTAPATLLRPLPQRESGTTAAATTVAAPRRAAGRALPVMARAEPEPTWQDSLGREFDFYLEHFPEEPGPRETILPHNPLITREMEIKVGDVLIGRPLGMSCGCPITHCGVATEVDPRTGVIVWCVTGPLRPRQEGFKDLGYYTAEAYDGLIRKQRPDVEVKIGMRYFFQPRMCMLQWRHSGLVNFMNRTKEGLQVRLEGLWIG
jgi:uncharacterized Fe-S cluster-containing protein